MCLLNAGARHPRAKRSVCHIAKSYSGRPDGRPGARCQPQSIAPLVVQVAHGAAQALNYYFIYSKSFRFVRSHSLTTLDRPTETVPTAPAANRYYKSRNVFVARRCVPSFFSPPQLAYNGTGSPFEQHRPTYHV
jgi:hypothetical protein